MPQKLSFCYRQMVSTFLHPVRCQQARHQHKFCFQCSMEYLHLDWNVCWYLLYASWWWWTGLSLLDVYLLVALLTHLVSWTCSWLQLSVALSWFLRWSDWQVSPVLCLFQFYSVISLDYVSVERDRVQSLLLNILQSQLFKYRSFRFSHSMYLNLGTLCYYLCLSDTSLSLLLIVHASGWPSQSVVCLAHQYEKVKNNYSTHWKRLELCLVSS